MGYCTEFSGSLTITPALTNEQSDFIKLHANTRRMKRDPNVLLQMYGWEHLLPWANNYGPEGTYFARDDGNYGQNQNDKSIINFNAAPQWLSLWCPWTINSEWELECESGKAYEYKEWLEFMIEHFFKPWGCTLAWVVHYRWEDFTDVGQIIVKDNVVVILSWTDFHWEYNGIKFHLFNS